MNPLGISAPRSLLLCFDSVLSFLQPLRALGPAAVGRGRCAIHTVHSHRTHRPIHTAHSHRCTRCSHHQFTPRNHSTKSHRPFTPDVHPAVHTTSTSLMTPLLHSMLFYIVDTGTSRVHLGPLLDSIGLRPISNPTLYRLPESVQACCPAPSFPPSLPTPLVPLLT